MISSGFSGSPQRSGPMGTGDTDCGDGGWSELSESFTERISYCIKIGFRFGASFSNSVANIFWILRVVFSC